MDDIRINPSLLRALENLHSQPSADASTEETAEEREARLRQEERRRLREAGVPERFISATLDGEQPHPRVAQALAQAHPMDSYYLHGPCGTGKTWLAVAYLRHWCAGNRGRVRFVTAPRLFAQLRASYDGDERELEILDRYARAGLLVLDDLGSESIRSADWTSDRLYLILGERHDECRPTVITSNCDLSAIAERLGERIAWRIAESCGGTGIIEVGGRNLRAPK